MENGSRMALVSGNSSPSSSTTPTRKHGGPGSQAQPANQHRHDRQQQLLALFVVGLCAGIIISERMYIHNTRAALQQQQGTAVAGGGPQQPSLAGTAAAGGVGSLKDRKFMRGGSTSSAVKGLIAGASSSSSAKTSSSLPSTVSTAAVAGALAAEVAAAEAAAVAAISEQLVRTDPQLRELEAYLRKVGCCLDSQLFGKHVGRTGTALHVQCVSICVVSAGMMHASTQGY